VKAGVERVLSESIIAARRDKVVKVVKVVKEKSFEK